MITQKYGKKRVLVKYIPEDNNNNLFIENHINSKPIINNDLMNDYIKEDNNINKELISNEE